MDGGVGQRLRRRSCLENQNAETGPRQFNSGHAAGREDHGASGVMSRYWGQIARLFHSIEQVTLTLTLPLTIPLALTLPLP